MAHEMIHGGGSDYNTGNRWFDKTMQVNLWPVNVHFNHKITYIIIKMLFDFRIIFLFLLLLPFSFDRS